MIKDVTLEQEVALESTLVLSDCQKQIRTFAEEDDIGICGCCDLEKIGFYDQVYLSKYVITETCKKKCPRLKR